MNDNAGQRQPTGGERKDMREEWRNYLVAGLDPATGAYIDTQIRLRCQSDDVAATVCEAMTAGWPPAQSKGIRYIPVSMVWVEDKP
jgi:hypothetical protein